MRVRLIVGSVGAIAAVCVGGCTRPGPAREVAERSFNITATMKSDAEIRRELLSSQRVALARETQGLEEATQLPRGYAEGVIGDWRVEKREADLTLVTGLRSVDAALRSDPYIGVRAPSAAVPAIPPADLTGLDRALAGLDVLRGEGQLAAGDFALFGKDLLQALDLQRKDAPTAGQGTSGT